MGGPRRKGALAARRRPGDEGEDDGFVVGQDDSLSEPSVPSDVDDDADGEGSESGELDTPNRKQNGKNSTKLNVRPDAVVAEKQPQFATKMAETDIMLNGLTIADGSEQAEEIHFSELPESLDTAVSNDTTDIPTKPTSLADKKRREHEDYKKRRDADPAFVPNRGGFYMHDERHASEQQAANGHRPAIRGRGRGRGGFVNNNFEHPVQADQAPWTHDLHETVSEQNGSRIEPIQTTSHALPDQQRRPVIQPISNPPPNRTFSSTTQIGNLQLRVYLTGMSDPIVFSSVPLMHHVRLPHHRPPLRRDKPVRISLPDSPVRYIFPAVDRSFIFIPRALRPNQQGFGRTRGRGSIGGPGGLRSGRNSIHGGSVYTPSIAMSRRSSFARERDGMVSPAMSVMSRATGPIVRLPNGGTPHQGTTPVHFGQQVPYKSVPPPHGGYQHAASYNNIPMHQPRPQKAVAVADIEPHAQQYYQGYSGQPFAHQVPPHFGDPNMSRRPSYPSQRGTPLSNIPERAIHAQPFQPYPQGGYHHQMGPQMPPPPPPQQQMYYPQQPYNQGMYYYPQAPPQQAPSPGQAPYNGYVAAPPQAPPMPEPAAQTGLVAHETNGMVYYYDPNAVLAEIAGPQANMPYQPMPYNGGYMMPQQQQGAVYYPPPPP